jgi:hypothetical protein
MKIDICEVIENEDGSADYKFLFDEEALILFARLGMRAAIEKELKRHGHPDTEGSGDACSGGGSDTDFHEQFPGL